MSLFAEHEFDEPLARHKGDPEGRVVLPGVTHHDIAITPEIAKKYLVLNIQNYRLLRKKKVAEYANAMELGLWTYTGQGLQFDKEGNLLNGQHRLHAIIASGYTVVMLVTWGVEDALNTDRGSPRTLADSLRKEGFKNCSALVTIYGLKLTIEEALETGKFVPRRRHGQYLVQYVKDNHAIMQRMHKEAKATGDLFIASRLAACLLVFSERAPDIFEVFLESMRYWTSLQAEDPISVLRSAMWNQKRRANRKPEVLWEIGMITKAFALYQKEKTCKILKYNTVGHQAEAFPKI